MARDLTHDADPPRVATFAAARVRDMPMSWQAFLFFTLSQLFKYLALLSPAPIRGLTPEVMLYIFLMFSPFLWARIPPLLAITPPLFLRREARVDLHPGGLVYTFDNVKRPLIVEWPDLKRLSRGRFGLTIEVRNTANVTEGMPKFQAEFWGKRVRRPIRIRCVHRFGPGKPLDAALSAARRAGVEVEGFAAPHSHQGSMRAMSSSDQPK